MPFMNNIYLLPDLCGREAVTAKDGVGLGRRNNELNELTNFFEA